MQIKGGGEGFRQVFEDMQAAGCQPDALAYGKLLEAGLWPSRSTKGRYVFFFFFFFFK